MSAPNSYSLQALAEDSSGRLLAVAITFTILNLSCAVMRLLSIRIQGRRFELHDLFSYIGLLFVLGECAMGFVLIYYAGVGRHTRYLELTAPYKIQRDLLVKYPVQIIYISAFTFPKISILCLYQKIFAIKTMRFATTLLIAVVVMTWVGETLSGIFQCTPIAYSWDRSIADGYCVNQTAMYKYWSVPNIITDVIILLLPIPVVWRLNTPRLQKAGLTLTFLLGGMGLVSCIVRFVTFFQNNAFQDPNWASVTLHSWTIVETSLYFIAGVLPTLRPVGLSFWAKVSRSSKVQLSQPSTSFQMPGYRLGSDRIRYNDNMRGHISGTSLVKAPSQTPDVDHRCARDDITLLHYKHDAYI